MYIFHILIIFTYGLVEDCPSEHFSRPSDQISILTRRLWNLVKYLSSTMQHYPLFVSLFQATKDATTVKMTSLDPVDPLYPPPDLPHPPTHSTPILTGSSSFSSSTDQPSFLCDTTSITEMNCLIVKKHQMPLTPPSQEKVEPSGVITPTVWKAFYVTHHWITACSSSQTMALWQPPPTQRSSKSKHEQFWHSLSDLCGKQTSLKTFWPFVYYVFKHILRTALRII